MKLNQIEIYENYIQMLLRGHVHSVLCHSKAGFGKTYTTIKLLEDAQVEYRYNSGVTTAVELFKLLYDNRNKVLILDDIETIFQDDRIINLLKSALWEVKNKRLVTYKTSSKVLKQYPDTFEYKGKLIILANELKGRNDESYKALMSRCLMYELVYTLKELKTIGYTIVQNEIGLSVAQKEQVISIMNKQINPQHNFNFRLLKRLMAFVRYDSKKAEELFVNSLNVDEEVELILDIIKHHKIVKDQVKVFNEMTGGSRMTFFRKKKQLKKEGLI